MVVFDIVVGFKVLRGGLIDGKSVLSVWPMSFLAGVVLSFPGVVRKARSARAGSSVLTMAFLRLRLTVCIVLTMKLLLSGCTCNE